MLAERGDRAGALRTWAQAYGERAPTTKRLAEVLAENGDLDGAVSAWQVSDALRNNPLGRHQAYVRSLPPEDKWEAADDGVGPEGWESMESEQLARLLAERGTEAAIAELRARAAAGDRAARRPLIKGGSGDGRCGPRRDRLASSRM